jgi:hypothetical protein
VAKYIVGSPSARRATDDQQVAWIISSLEEFVTDVAAVVLHVDPDSLGDLTALPQHQEEGATPRSNTPPFVYLPNAAFR